MADYSKQDVLNLLSDVVSLRKYQPKLLEKLYTESTLGILHKVKFQEHQKAPETIPNVPVNVPADDLNINDEELKNEIIEQLHVLHILRANKNCRMSKIMNNS